MEATSGESDRHSPITPYSPIMGYSVFRVFVVIRVMRSQWEVGHHRDTCSPDTRNIGTALGWNSHMSGVVPEDICVPPS